jgi:hypothetical protein
MAELAVRVYAGGVPAAPDNRGLYVGRATDGLVDAVTRLLDLTFVDRLCRRDRAGIDAALESHLKQHARR